MKLGYAIPKFFDPHSPDPYRGTYELARLAEEAGFAFGSVPHHSFTPGGGAYAAPLLMLAALAARTASLRLLSSIFILPLHQPVAIAEQLAELDRISNGRLIFGAGVGYREDEYAGHGVDIHRRGRRMDEMLAIISGALETGYLDYAGEFFQVPRSPLSPQPVQKPRLPIWIGGSADAALRRAARYGSGWLTDNQLTLDAIKERVAAYRAFSDAAARPHGQVAIARNAGIATSRAEAETAWLPRLVDYHLFNRANYRAAGIDVPDPGGIYARLEAGQHVPFAELVQDRAIAGTPDDCIGQIKRWEAETGCDYVLLVSSIKIESEEEFEAQKRFIELFGREVVPAI